MANKEFVNFVEGLSDSDAKEVLERARQIVILGEQDRQRRVEKAKRNRDFWLNNIWTDAHLEFFDDLDISPYEFPVQRSLVNNLISRQRSSRFTFEMIPTDIHSYKRHRRGREKYIREYGDRHPSPRMAGEYYDKYGDDQYAKAVSTLLHNVRIETDAKHIESESFQAGLITGLDFLKAIFSDTYDKKGGVEITRRPQRAVFYDESSVDYSLRDIEFIGEIHLLYKDQLIEQYPQHKEKIEEHFTEFTNLDQRSFVDTSRRREENYEHYYDFDPSSRDTEERAKVAELWFLDIEERFLIINNETGEKRLVPFGLEEEQILDRLLTEVLADMQEEARDNPEMLQRLQSEDAKQQVAQIADERYDLEVVNRTVWKKAVLTYNALFELKRSPLPHDSHPYYPFFAQFDEGEFTSLMDDIEDVILAINKALAIRELMMAHGSKQLVIVNEEALANSDYDLDDIADQWTSIGGIIALKPRQGENIRDIVDSISTVGDGLPAINAVIQDLEQKLFQISGVNLAQLGITQRETPASGLRQQILQGQSNNGLIFDNFLRSLETFYQEKVVPLVVWLMRHRKQKVIRSLSDEFKPWIEIDFGEDFRLFEDAVAKGQFSLNLKTKGDNEQIQEQRASKYLELAMANPQEMPLEVALEFSTDPERHKIIQRVQEVRQERMQRLAANQVTIQQVQRVAAELGIQPEVAQNIVKRLQKERAKQMQQEEGGSPEAIQQAQAAPTIREEASQPEKTEGIENSITNLEQVG